LTKLIVAGPFGKLDLGVSYDLRRLLRKGIICRVAGTQRCYLTPYGWRLARFYARLEARVFRPALTATNDPPLDQMPH
jgi:hypothetical protein